MYLLGPQEKKSAWLFITCLKIFAFFAPIYQSVNISIFWSVLQDNSTMVNSLKRPESRMAFGSNLVKPSELFGSVKRTINRNRAQSRCQCKHHQQKLLARQEEQRQKLQEQLRSGSREYLLYWVMRKWFWKPEMQLPFIQKNFQRISFRCCVILDAIDLGWGVEPWREFVWRYFALFTSRYTYTSSNEFHLKIQCYKFCTLYLFFWLGIVNKFRLHNFRPLVHLRSVVTEIATEMQKYQLTLVSFGKTESKPAKLNEKLSISVIWSADISEFQLQFQWQ